MKLVPKSKQKERKLNQYKAHYLTLIIDGLVTKESAKTKLDKSLFAKFSKLNKKQKYEKLDELDKLVAES